jgi:hypothetical protein
VDDRAAKSTTTEEIQDIINSWWPKAKADLKARGLAPKLSMDNIAIQAGAKGVGLVADQRIHLPPYSPDMHKVIEHEVGQLKRAVYTRLYKEHYNVTSAQVQQIVRDIFYCNVDDPVSKKKAADLKAGMIKRLKADSDDLFYTYKVISMEEGTEWVDDQGIVHRGVGGGWPKARYR